VKRFQTAARGLSKVGDAHRRAARVAASIGRVRAPEELAALVGLLASQVFEVK